MTKSELIAKVEEEIVSLEKTKKIDNSLLECFTKFRAKYQGINMSDFDTINLYEVGVCYFLMKRNDVTLEEVSTLLMPIGELVKIDFVDIGELFDDINKIIHFKEERLLEIMITDNMSLKKKTKELFVRNKGINPYVEEALRGIEKIIEENYLDRNSVLEFANLMKKYPFEIWDIKNICGNVKLISTFNDLVSKSAYEDDKEEEDRIRAKVMNNANYVNNQLDAIFRYTDKLRKKESARIAKVDKKELPLKEFLNDFLSDEKEITNYQSMIEKIPEYLRLDALKLMYLHNEEVYNDIDKRYNDLSNNKRLKYQSLLSNYDIKLSSLSLLQIPYDKLDRSLQLLRKFGITNTTMPYILENTTVEILEEINLYLERGIINKKFIKNNYLILLPGEEYNNLSNNIKLLEGENINPSTFNASSKVLLTDNKLFIDNINTLKEYNLLNSMKTTGNYNFLGKANLVTIIDKLLELGMEKILEENIGLLNNKNLDRLYILKLLDIEVSSYEELVAYLNLKNFYVDDADIFNYVSKSNVSLDSEARLVSLDVFPKTSRTININGVIFSKNKVERNLKSTSLRDTKEALFKDIILSEEEVELVDKALKEKIYVK